jgi:hypothetical protein
MASFPPFLTGSFLVGGGLVPLVVLALLVFKLWMIIDCLKNESSQGNDKLLWLLVIIFVPFGSLVYFFVRKQNRP